jgi:hypothetical protein
VLGFQWLSAFFVSSENILKKVLDSGVGERYPLCIESPGNQAAHLARSLGTSFVDTMKRINMRGVQ